MGEICQLYPISPPPMNPLGYVVSEKPKAGKVSPSPPTTPVVKGAPLKSVLALPMLAPAFTPTYQPVQLKTGAAGAIGGAFMGISAAKAGVPNSAIAATAVDSFFMRAP